jgi:hypothetical protein
MVTNVEKDKDIYGGAMFKSGTKINKSELVSKPN